ncbi:type II toxin-antitoxin system death-on-curing family toxin [Streptosporangium sp. NBC_01755]|uniref:type II toxin-antitoxin system death-on-curing family toxin n=1 Tax=unclassified Streptosporangium TaxID=2632669 RepID=UPI002DD7EA53|nr:MULTISPECIES: type II toxin-antitoxin system death-on-curing family toxin [unclassified Streptosporangium]WSA27613.1 type II toxin-antitoxin system death-on-curing family toxin [Streptosporangium sp. NBC_01810]WSD00914.1 type II toxin-antitoxin system death-on-curing family toxin [Streptosporangium sp. NBC_01755]
MTRYLTVEQVLDLAELAIGATPELRDLGLLDSAVHRPQASMFGQEAYPDLFVKAAALLHSLAANHPFVDGNKRVAWVAAVVFMAWNGKAIDTGDDEAYDLVIAVASGKLTEVDEIAEVLRSFAVPA